MKIRSFLAFDITDKMKTELASVISILSPKTKCVRWVKPELMHCTLRFFGDVEEEFLLGNISKTVKEQVKHQSPIHLEGRGVGAFPNWRYPRVLWAGLIGEVESMMSLHTRLEEEFEGFGFEKDPRSFRLHLTLGRAKSQMKNCQSFMQVVEKMADLNFGDVTVKSLTLYRSELTREGSIYTALRKFDFGTIKNKTSK